MQRKNLIMVLGAVLMSALLVGAGVVAGGMTDGGDAPQANLDQQANDDTRSITVTASGDVQTEPDQAVLRVSIEATDDEPGAARSKVAENASSMRDALREIGIEDDQVRTTGFHIYEDRERPRDPEAEPEVTYRARHMFEIELDDVESVGDVIDAAIDGGATHVNGVEFTLSEETRQELRQDALEEAMGNARMEAETIAAAENVSVGSMHSATTEAVRFPHQRVRYAAMAEAGDAAASTSIEPGDVTVSATVSIEYEVVD